MAPTHPADQTRRRLSDLRPETPGRVLMAASGLVVLHLDPPDYGLLPQAMNPLLIAYVVFVLAVLMRELLRYSSPGRFDWWDLAWILTLTSATGGTSSVLFFMLLLPIISRAFRKGFNAGWRMTLIASAGLLVCGLPTAPGGMLFELNRAMIRPLTLLILGYILSREGGAQHRALRQLALLAAISAVGNPRLGADRTLLNAAHRIREAYKVRECLIVLPRDDHRWQVARANAQGEALESYSREAAELLMILPSNASALLRPQRVVIVPPETGHPAAEEACRSIADLLDSPCLLTVPLRRAGATVGRLFLLDPRLKELDGGELALLERAAEHLMLLIERIRLLDELGAVAGRRERSRLAHDLHDLAIQPYLGVQLGLSALLRRPECPEPVVEELGRLQQLAQQGVSELPGLLDERRAEDSVEVHLESALAALADHYREHFGIHVAVRTGAKLSVGGRLAEEAVAIVSEGLSNVRRHTASTQVSVALDTANDQLRIEISNRNAGAPPAAFVPRSISARVRGLGGDGAMETDRDGCTVLCLCIPL